MLTVFCDWFRRRPQVHVHVDYVKPAEDGYEERVCVTLKLDDMYEPTCGGRTGGCAGSRD